MWKNKIRKTKLFEEFSPYISYLTLKPGASKETISAVQAILAISLPEQYLDFLRLSNGADGFVGVSYLTLWALEELEQFNREYQVTEFAPGLLLIGSNGGGEAYAIDLQNNIFGMVPFIGMELAEFTVCGETFLEFLESLATDT